jgi:hypothetical protein
MELFVERYLDSQYDVLGASFQSLWYSDNRLHDVCYTGGLESKERQQLYYLSKKSGPLRNVRVMKDAYTFLSEPWTFDVEGNLVLQEYNYIRVPLIIQADVEVPVFMHAPLRNCCLWDVCRSHLTACNCKHA